MLTSVCLSFSACITYYKGLASRNRNGEYPPHSTPSPIPSPPLHQHPIFDLPILTHPTLRPTRMYVPRSSQSDGIRHLARGRRGRYVLPPPFFYNGHFPLHNGRHHICDVPRHAIYRTLSRLTRRTEVRDLNRLFCRSFVGPVGVNLRIRALRRPDRGLELLNSERDVCMSICIEIEVSHCFKPQVPYVVVVRLLRDTNICDYICIIELTRKIDIGAHASAILFYSQTLYIRMMHPYYGILDCLDLLVLPMLLYEIRTRVSP